MDVTRDSLSVSPVPDGPKECKRCISIRQRKKSIDPPIELSERRAIKHLRIVDHLSGPFDLQVRCRRPRDGDVFRTERPTCGIHQDLYKDNYVDDASNLEEDWKRRQENETSQTEVAEWVDGDEANKQNEIDKYRLKGANDSDGNVHLGEKTMRASKGSPVESTAHRRGPWILNGQYGMNLQTSVSDCTRSATYPEVFDSLQTRQSLRPR